MARFIPYRKLHKKKRQELDRQKRGSWNGVDPVTRRPEDSKAYNRSKAQSWKKETGDALFLCVESDAGRNRQTNRRLDIGSMYNLIKSGRPSIRRQIPVQRLSARLIVTIYICVTCAVV